MIQAFSWHVYLLDSNRFLLLPWPSQSERLHSFQVIIFPQDHFRGGKCRWGSCRAYHAAHLWAPCSPRNPYILHQESRKVVLEMTLQSPKPLHFCRPWGHGSTAKVVKIRSKRLERSGAFSFVAVSIFAFLSCLVLSLINSNKLLRIQY